LVLAKHYRIPVRIVHCHQNIRVKSKASRLIQWICAGIAKWYATDWWACGRDAGICLFGKRAMEKGSIHILNNAIDLAEFDYDANVRKAFRNRYDLEGKIVVGMVGRFTKQKNHQKLIQVFQQFHEGCPESVLLLIGEGECREQIQDQVKRMGMGDDVILAGASNEVSSFLQAMDLFVLPSIFEGLPIVLIEAQCTGLPCVVSGSVTDEVDVCGLISFVDLSAPDDEWVKNMMDSISKSGSRTSRRRQLEQAGYDIDAEAKKLEEWYVSQGSRICHMEDLRRNHVTAEKAE
ncbi:MAG: glycosyltransferase, partial [Oscillospiraceae bacterium]|nr:glycosyltransferase [Oscillospiraceae bacterium]